MLTPSNPRCLRPVLVLGFALIAGCASQGQQQPGPAQPEVTADGSGFVAQLSSSRGRSSTGTHRDLNRRHPPARRHHGRHEGAAPSPSPTPSPSPSPSLGPLAERFVTAHNLYRSAASPAANPPLPPVRWSSELAATAQAWADRCEFEHSYGEFGENLSAGTNMAGPEQIVDGWASEGDDYDYAGSRCAAGQICGHYTQIVWRDSTEIGCAVAQCSGGGPFGGTPWVMWVCNYSPAGNYVGERPY